MKTFRMTWLPLLGLAALLSTSTPAWAEKAAKAGNADKLVPAGSEMITVINVRQLLNAPIVKKYALAQMKAALAKEEKVTKPLQAAGIDPFKDVDTIVIAGPAGPEFNKKGLAIVRGRFDLEKIGSTADAFAEKNEGKLKVLKEGDLRIYEAKNDKGDDKPGYLAFVDDKTLVISPAKEAVLEAAKGEKNGKPSRDPVGGAEQGQLQGQPVDGPGRHGRDEEADGQKPADGPDLRQAGVDHRQHQPDRRPARHHYDPHNRRRIGRPGQDAGRSVPAVPGRAGPGQ